MTLAGWLQVNPTVGYTFLPGNSVQVFSTDPALWRLSDYRVTSAVSGPSVMLVVR